MTATWGRKFKITIFGESHGMEIGAVIDGVPSGICIDFDEIYFEMKRRSPGSNKISTQRKESDTPRILSGIFNGKTTGAPIAISIKNTNHNSNDYEEIKNLMRPGHADYSAYIKFNGNNDYRGGGHFSGRITAPLVFAGALAKQILSKKEIFVGSHIRSIKNIYDESFSEKDLSKANFDTLKKERLPLVNKNLKSEIENLTISTKENFDSVGGVVECAIIGVEAGVGSPFFESIESIISGMVFSIPSVKGIEFGDGFDITKKFGSQANDEMYYKDKTSKVCMNTNHNGGILGGITNGMPIVFKVAVKPTPSIAKKQKTIDISRCENIELEIKGRHDPIIVPRIIPVLESVAAISILDCLMSEGII